MLCFNYTVGFPWSVPVLSRLLSASRREPPESGRKPLHSTEDSQANSGRQTPQNPCESRGVTTRANRSPIGFTQQPDWPSPQSQSFSRSYGSNLPTSLTYIVLKTRGYAPWRPAADIGTACQEVHYALLGFSRDDDSAPDTARTAVLYGHYVPISGQADSREHVP